MAMPANSDTRLIQGAALAMAMMLTRPRKVAAKNSGWSKARASLAKGGAPKVSSRALTRPPVAEAAMASDSARADFAALGHRVAVPATRQRGRRAGDVDQDRRDRAAEHTAGIDAAQEGPSPTAASSGR
jgi:hypothetical protein